MRYKKNPLMKKGSINLDKIAENYKSNQDFYESHKMTKTTFSFIKMKGLNKKSALKYDIYYYFIED